MGMETLTQFDEILRLIYKNWYICRYELPINLQNFMQKYLTEVIIFLNVLGGLLFLRHPVCCLIITIAIVIIIGIIKSPRKHVPSV